MAACRLGYMVAHRDVVAACESVVLPYHLDAVTQAAGVLAFLYEDEMQDRIAVIVSERNRLQAGLESLGVEHWPSEANFVLFRPTSPDAKKVWVDLLEESVLIRDCSDWPGLSGCLRVTVGTPAENNAFLEALGKSLSTNRTRI
jgi:histidinol-phosphate aminotransferase